jgi:hypothetical protein
VRVEGGRFQARVPEHGLDHAHVGAVLKHERGHRVAKEMARTRFADPRGRDVLPSEQGQVARGHRTPKSGDERRRVVRVDEARKAITTDWLSVWKKMNSGGDDGEDKIGRGPLGGRIWSAAPARPTLGSWIEHDRVHKPSQAKKRQAQTWGKVGITRCEGWLSKGA